MFHHDHRITQRLQLTQHLYQQIGISRMQPDTRLIQYIQGTDQAAAQRSRQVNTLTFTTRQRSRKAVERQIPQPDIQQELQAVHNLRQQTFCHGRIRFVQHQVVKKGFCFRDRQCHQFSYILTAYFHIERFRFQAGPFTGRTGRLSPITSLHDTVLYFIKILFHKLEKVVDAVQAAGTMPQQVFFLLRQVVIRTMYREVVFLALGDKLLQPLSHHFAFPADHRPLKDRQTLIRYHQVLIDTQYFSESFTDRTGSQRIIKTEHHIGRFDKRDTIRFEFLGIFLYHRPFGSIDTDNTGIMPFKKRRFRRIGQTAFQCLIVRNRQTVDQQFNIGRTEQCLIRQHLLDTVSRVVD